MNSSEFFIAWELWAQLSFVLACGIVAVFFAGLIKLWWKNRYVRKHTLLDEEKRARQTEMQKSGLPAGRRVDIPFGVRAIQSGVEVDGIWISRPNTPVDSESRTPSVVLGADGDAKGKERAVDAGIAQAPRPTAQETASVPTEPRSPQNSVRETYQPKRVIPRPQQATFHDAAAPLETYVPTSSTSNQQRESRDRNSSSSSEDGSHSSQQRYMPTFQLHPSAPPRKRSPFADPEPSSPTADILENGGYFRKSELYHESGNPFDTPGSSSMDAYQTSNETGSSMGGRPRQTSRSGDMYANTATRRVNAGFEVLPAGTFSRTNSQMDHEDEQFNNRESRSGINKLQKKGR